MEKVKKGKPSWRPAQRLSVKKRPEGYVLRWANKDTANLQKKQAEGWVFANKENGVDVEQEMPGMITGTGKFGSTPEYRDAVLMAIDETTAQERRDYFQERSDDQIRAIKAKAEQENAENARRYGVRPTALRGELIIR